MLLREAAQTVHGPGEWPRDAGSTGWKTAAGSPSAASGFQTAKFQFS